MSIKTTINSLDEVDENLRPLYKQEGEGSEAVFVLETDDGDYTKKIGEFRNNNIKMMKEVEDLKKKLAESDGAASEAQKLKEALDKQKQDKLLQEGNIEEIVSARTQSMKSDYEKRLTAATTRADELEKTHTDLISKLNGIKVKDEVTAAVNSVGSVKAGAMTDVLLRASSTWKVNEHGDLEAFGSDGNPLYGSKGHEKLKVSEWATDLLTSVPYLFEPSSGGGARGSSGSGSPGGKFINAGDKKSFSRNLEDIANSKVTVVTTS